MDSINTSLDEKNLPKKYFSENIKEKTKKNLNQIYLSAIIIFINHHCTQALKSTSNVLKS